MLARLLQSRQPCRVLDRFPTRRSDGVHETLTSAPNAAAKRRLAPFDQAFVV